MSASNRPSRPIHPFDRPSEVRRIADRRMLPIVDDLPHSHPDLIKKVTEAIQRARRQVEGTVANDDGQGLLFPETGQEASIPEIHADQIIRIAQADLAGRGISLQKTADSIKIVAEEESESPFRSTGY